MHGRILSFLMVVLAGTFGIPAQAHYSMLLPQSGTARRGVPVTLRYQWGHPYEHQLFDAPAPPRLVCHTPAGAVLRDLEHKLVPVKVPLGDGGSVTAYELNFTPEERGDYLFVLETAPIWMADEEHFFLDRVQLVLHVQAQKNWDQPPEPGPFFELAPLTRPYGLQAGMVLQGQLKSTPPRPDSSAEGVLVEVERYNPTPPKRIPADEHVTRVVKSGPGGVFTASLPEAGWWCFTASRRDGTREHEGKAFPLLRRSTHWVYVDEKPIE